MRVALIAMLLDADRAAFKHAVVASDGVRVRRAARPLIGDHGRIPGLGFLADDEANGS